MSRAGAQALNHPEAWEGYLGFIREDCTPEAWEVERTNLLAAYARPARG